MKVSIEIDSEQKTVVVRKDGMVVEDLDSADVGFWTSFDGHKMIFASMFQEQDDGSRLSTHLSFDDIQDSRAKLIVQENPKLTIGKVLQDANKRFQAGLSLENAYGARKHTKKDMKKKEQDKEDEE